MPVYYFHIRSSTDFIRDDEGIDLAGMPEVREEAREGAKIVLQEAIAKDQVVDGHSFEVTDEAGDIVLRYPFRDAMRLS